MLVLSRRITPSRDYETFLAPFFFQRSPPSLSYPFLVSLSNDDILERLAILSKWKLDASNFFGRWRDNKERLPLRASSFGGGERSFAFLRDPPPSSDRA